MTSQTQALLADPKFVESVEQGIGVRALSRKFCCSYGTTQRARLKVLESPATQTPSDASKPVKTDYRAKLRHAESTVPVEIDWQSKVLELTRSVQELEEKLVWAQHSKPASRTGGKFTLLRSDLHYGDKAHMIRSAREMHDKCLVLLKQYKPDEIVIVSNGDEICGVGIYKNQNMDSAVQTTNEQTWVGAYKIYEFDQRVRKAFPNATVTWKVTKGNHDRNMGETTTPLLVMTARSLGVNASFCGDEALLNLASAGYHYMYAEHGYGYSNISPSSPRWIANMQEKLLILGQRYYGDRRINRVTHGHTHSYLIGMERIRGLFFDTTGGCQKNERVLLGKNNRPMGFIAYVSPAGHPGILDPIGIQPSNSTVETDLNDHFLFKENMQDCSETIVAFMKLAEELGISELLEPEGR